MWGLCIVCIVFSCPCNIVYIIWFLFAKFFIPVRKTFQDVGEELGLAPVAGVSPKWLLSLLRKFHLEAIQKQLNAIYSLPL